MCFWHKVKLSRWPYRISPILRKRKTLGVTIKENASIFRRASAINRLAQTDMFFTIPVRGLSLRSKKTWDVFRKERSDGIVSLRTSPNGFARRKHATKKTGYRLSFSLVTRTGLEPMFSPWEGDVLTAWPTGLIELYFSVPYRTGLSLNRLIGEPYYIVSHQSMLM